MRETQKKGIEKMQYRSNPIKRTFTKAELRTMSNEKKSWLAGLKTINPKLADKILLGGE